MIPELISDIQKASTVAEALKDAAVKVVILNACDSANAQGNHTNLAQIFVEAGVTTVVAMSYAVLAESAKIFVSHFYEKFLHRKLDADVAAFEARRAMKVNPLRRGAFGLMRPVDDGATPVVYKSYSGSLSWQGQPSENAVLPVVTPESSPSGAPFVGRDIDILQLEDLLSWKNALYLYGPAACGKTSLARHLESWWVKTGFFESIHSISCRTFKSFDEATLYKILASLIQGKIADGSNIDGLKARQVVHQCSCIIFIDDCETTAGKIGLEHFGLPGLDHEAARSLQRFVDGFCADDEVRSRLVLLSRTDALMADHIRDSNGRITKQNIGYYELKELRSTDVAQVMKNLGGAGSILNSFNDGELKEVADLISFHDNNVTMASLLTPCIHQAGTGQDVASVADLDLALQADLPTPMSTSISDRFDTSAQDITVFSDFASVMANLRSCHPDVHRTMLCFALNRNRCLNFANLSGYLLNLAGWELLPGCPGSRAFRLSTPLARRAMRRPDRFHTKIFDHSPATRDALRDAMKILKVIGLVEEDITMTSQHYYKLHPLLPYLLRAEILWLDNSHDFTQALHDSFLDYWHFRASQWTEAGKDTVPGFIETEWPNLCCAIDLCMQQRDFGEGNIEVFDALKHVLKPGGRTAARIEKCQKLLAKAISRFSTRATQSPDSVLPLPILARAMTLVRLWLQFSDAFEADQSALDCIRQSTELLESSRRAHGEVDSESWCTGMAINFAVLRDGLAADQSHKCSLIDSIWNAKLPEDISDDSSLLIFDTQFHLLFQLMDQNEQMQGCGINRDMIQAKADDILNAMAEHELDSTNLELLWSIFKAKHWSENTSIPFNLNGVSQVEDIIQLLQRQGFEMDEDDPVFAVPMAIRYRNDPARARSILLNALHQAHIQDDRHEQRALHRVLFISAAENRDIEHSTFHFDEMIKLDYEIAAAKSSSATQDNLLSRDQLRLEARGNTIIAEIVIHQHATQYNLQPGNAVPGTSRPPREANAADRALTLSRLQRSLKLSLDNDFRDLQCAAHLALGSREAFLEARPNAAWAHFARAVALGDDVNQKHKERFVLGINLAQGRFVMMLMTAWQFKARDETRDEISRHVSEGLGGRWSASQIRTFLDLTFSGAGIRGATLDHSFFQEPPLCRYFEEAQQILFDHNIDDDTFIFWRRDGSDWVFDEEAASEASMHALFAGSRRQNPQNWEGMEPLELPKRFRKYHF